MTDSQNVTMNEDHAVKAQRTTEFSNNLNDAPIVAATDDESPTVSSSFFWETQRLLPFINKLYSVPVGLRQYALLDFETQSECHVKLENITSWGSIEARAIIAAIVRSASLCSQRGISLDKDGLNVLSSSVRTMHVRFQTDDERAGSNHFLLVHGHQVAFIAKKLGFDVVCHMPSVFSLTALGLYRLLQMKQIGVTFTTTPDDVEEREENGFLFDVAEAMDYCLEGLATVGLEIMKENPFVQEIYVPSQQSGSQYMNLSKALTKLFNSMTEGSHPTVISVEAAHPKEQKLYEDWLTCLEPKVRIESVFSSLLTFGEDNSGVIGSEQAVSTMKKAISCEELKCLFSPGTLFSTESTLTEFKRTIDTQIMKHIGSVELDYSDQFQSLSTGTGSAGNVSKQTVHIQDIYLAKALLAGFRITHTYTGLTGSLGLAALIQKEAQGCAPKVPVCVIVPGGGVTYAKAATELEWSQKISGTVLRISVNLPVGTDSTLKLLRLVKESHCSTQDVKNIVSSAYSDNACLELTINCPSTSRAQVLLSNLYRESSFQITILDGNPCPESSQPKVPRPITPVSEAPFEDEKHPYHLPQFSLDEITPESCEAAEARLRAAGLIDDVPIVHCTQYDKLTGCEIWMMLDNLQQTGSFKQRGSANAILRGIEESGVKPKGVLSVSAGNHAQGVALCCRAMGVPCTIVCPAEAPESKLAATRNLGAEVIAYGDAFEEALARGFEECEKRGAHFVHPFNHPGVIEGQATTAVALHRAVPDLDTVLVNVGGGGLISGVALYLRKLKDLRTSQGKRLRIIGIQGGNVAPLAGSESRGGIRNYVPIKALTIADGCNVKVPGGIHDSVLQDLVDAYIGVPEPLIAAAVSHAMISTHTILEGAGAIGLAAIMYGLIKVEPHEKIGLIICGANIDVDHFVKTLPLGECASGERLVVDFKVLDMPGPMESILSIAADCALTVNSIEHIRAEPQETLAAENYVLHLDLSTPNAGAQTKFLTTVIEKLGLYPTICGTDLSLTGFDSVTAAQESRIQQEAAARASAEHEWAEAERTRVQCLRNSSK